MWDAGDPLATAGKPKCDTRGKIRLKLRYDRQPGTRIDAFYRLLSGIATRICHFPAYESDD